jgi:hypothetical protein
MIEVVVYHCATGRRRFARFPGRGLGFVRIAGFVFKRWRRNAPHQVAGKGLVEPK